MYIAEQLTKLYTFLHKKHKNIIGSEFLNALAKPGSVNRYGIRHEHPLKLSFRNNSLGYYLSFEQFEHVPDAEKAFAECYRVLRKGGMMMWTVPFANLSDKNIIRARVLDGGVIEHLLPPEYHDYRVDPDEDTLCYTHFGWEMLAQLRAIGFKDAYAIVYWCDALGYYGGDQFIFCGVK